MHGAYRLTSARGVYQLTPIHGAHRLTSARGVYQLTPAHGAYLLMPTRGAYQLMFAGGAYHLTPIHGTSRLALPGVRAADARLRCVPVQFPAVWVVNPSNGPFTIRMQGVNGQPERFTTQMAPAGAACETFGWGRTAGSRP
ncbi:hypothetical protein GCM10009804_18800 [Kribbella hippodromi]|uniref:Carboxypeptidase regulatory-like domain-containing protein n=2 Tax=Kribbella hippodromi TaxID=434347 RepID=A0ABN2CRX9_9ACTN